MARIKQVENNIAIKLEHVTKDYKRGRGIFDISFEIPKGKVFGYCGTNGAGKTTTLRAIMGFIHPDSGKVTVNGLDAWKDSEKIKSLIGYLPGEICFPPVDSGSEFLHIQAELVGLKNMDKAERIINAMQLDPTADVKRMSKGMKQKTAIVAAMMNSPEILILDEPTTGLDPLMRDSFVKLILEEKKRGTTIIMSSHMFDELEETCDYVGLIKDGHLIDVVDMEKLRTKSYREYTLGLINKEDYINVDRSRVTILKDDPDNLEISFRIDNKYIDGMFKELKQHHIRFISEIKYDLEHYFVELMKKSER